MVTENLPRGVDGRDDPKKDKIPRALWGNPEAIARSKKLAWNPSKILLGALNNKLIGLDDDRHMCTVAGSRAGKGVSAIIPNLIHYKGSVLAIDPKGELASITATQRHEGLGQKVCVLDPFDRTAPWVKPYKKSFNPLSFLKINNPTIVEDAGLIADALVISSGQGDPHWDDSARNFIEGVILHVVTDSKYEDKRNLITVYELLARGTEFRRGEKVATGIKGLLLEMAANVDQLTENKMEDLAGTLDAATIDMSDRPEKEQGSVLSTIRRHVKFLGYSSIKTVLEGHDFDLDELKNAEGGMTIYLCLPAGRMGTCNRWLRMFINLALETMERLGQKDKPATGCPVLFCLDEFAILGHMRQIEDAAGQIASFHVKLWWILQDLTQLKTLYKDRWETFLGNAGILQFFGNNDITTLEFIQKRLGKTPVLTQSLSYSASEATSGESYKAELHDLITAEEAARFFSRDDPKGRQLVLWAGKDPMILERLKYHDTEHPLHQYFEDRYDEWRK